MSSRHYTFYLTSELVKLELKYILILYLGIRDRDRETEEREREREAEVGERSSYHSEFTRNRDS